MKVLHIITQCLALLAPLSAMAQAYPNKPVKIVAPAPAGSPADIISRALANELSVRFKAPFLVENKSGASGIIAAEYVARSAPDGLTLLVANDNMMVMNGLLEKNLRYDGKTSFAGVSMLMDTDLLLVVNSQTPVNSLAELVSYARDPKMRVAYGAYGNGSPPHLFFGGLSKAANINIVHVPYRGTSQIVQALLGDEVQLGLMSWGAAAEFLRAGRLKVLAVSSANRAKFLPDVPTIAEAGYKSLEISTWFTLVAPAGTPAEIIGKLNLEVANMLKDPKFAEENFSSKGYRVWPSSPDEIRNVVNSQTIVLSEKLKAAGLAPQ